MAEDKRNSEITDVRVFECALQPIVFVECLSTVIIPISSLPNISGDARSEDVLITNNYNKTPIRNTRFFKISQYLPTHESIYRTIFRNAFCIIQVSIYQRERCLLRMRSVRTRMLQKFLVIWNIKKYGAGKRAEI